MYLKSFVFNLYIYVTVVCCCVQLVDTTVEIANKVGAAEIAHRIVDDLKDENEQYRKMVMETVEKILANLGAADIDSRLEEQLIDGILYAFQEQTTEVPLSLIFYFWRTSPFGAYSRRGTISTNDVIKTNGIS